MECPTCKADLYIANSKYEALNDDTPDKTTEIFSVLQLVCINPKCGSFAGNNLDNPNMIIETVRNKVG
jgi:hypothetical protein